MMFGVLNVQAQVQSHRIFTSDGKSVTFEQMIRDLKSADIILFGELHNNPIAHWLQLETTKALYEYRELILGAEMIEADNQLQLNQYLKGFINSKQLDTLARLWPNHKTDYAPVVDFAKDNGLSFIATNIPRRYARMVHKNDFESLDTLSPEEKAWIAPLPITFDPNLPTYKKILEMMGGHGSEKLVKAQAIKDATMAYFILKNFNQGKLFLHLNGAFHSNEYEGILWYLKQQNNQLDYASISTVLQADVQRLAAENLHKADYIICVDSDMTTTY